MTGPPRRTSSIGSTPRPARSRRFACSLIFVLMIGAEHRPRFAAGAHGGINDMVSWLCAAAAFLAMAHAFKHGDFVRVTLLLDNLGAAARRVSRWRRC